MCMRLRGFRTCKKILFVPKIDDDIHVWLFSRAIISVVVFIVEALFFDEKDSSRGHNSGIQMQYAQNMHIPENGSEEFFRFLGLLVSNGIL